MAINNKYLTNDELKIIKRGLIQGNYIDVFELDLKEKLFCKIQKSKKDAVIADCYLCLSLLSYDNEDSLSLLYFSAKHGGMEASKRLLALLCGLDRITKRMFHKDIKEMKNLGYQFTNPMEYLKYKGYKYINIIIVLAYFAYTVDKDEQKALDYLYDFACNYALDIIESESEGLYDYSGFQYYNIDFEDTDHFIWNQTKVLFELLKSRKEDSLDIKFTYAVFLYGAICSVYEEDYSNQQEEALNLIQDLCNNNQKDAVYFETIFSAYNLNNRGRFKITVDQLISLGEKNEEKMYPYIAFRPDVPEEIRIKYLKKYINMNCLDSMLDWMVYLPTIFKELQPEHEKLWDKDLYQTWCFSDEFLNHLDKFLTREEINKVLFFLVERENEYDYDYEYLMNKYRMNIKEDCLG